MSGVEVILENLSKNPNCPHGPTVLFCQNSKKYFACAASRDRKTCPFYFAFDDLPTVNDAKRKKWLESKKQFVRGVNHRNSFVTFNKMQQKPANLRRYCQTCNLFILSKYEKNHEEHTVKESLEDYSMNHPSEFLPPLDNPKLEAQFLFSKHCVQVLMNLFKQMGFRNAICMGAPRIHEHIQSEQEDMTSILLDIDRRYLAFFGPLQFCWYNMFNNYFFLPDSQEVFKDFLQSKSEGKLVLVIDPPFGCRVELLAHNLNVVNKLYKSLNNTSEDLPVLLFFPYFMEPQVFNSLPNFTMLDYKVDYENHPLFQRGAHGRKLGSPVRIFTNIDASCFELPADDGYKHCKQCNRWVASENQHCLDCKACTSKDGSTYVHCKICDRCVKPTWAHCDKCNRCATTTHKCQELVFNQSCFHCKQAGHKKRDCPKVNQTELQLKRKRKMSKKESKKFKKSK